MTGPVCNCGGTAIIRVTLSAGCIAYPDDRDTGLCLQHIYSIVPRGTMEVVEVYEPEVYEWYEGTRGRTWSAADYRSGSTGGRR